MSWRVHSPRNDLTWLACWATGIRTLGDGPPNSLIGIRPWVDDVAIGSSLIDEWVIPGEIALASSRFLGCGLARIIAKNVHSFDGGRTIEDEVGDLADRPVPPSPELLVHAIRQGICSG